MNEFKYIIEIKQNVLLKTSLSIENGEHIQNSLYVVRQEVFERTDSKNIESLEHFPTTNDTVHLHGVFLPYCPFPLIYPVCR